MPHLRRNPESLPFIMLVPNMVTILGLSAGLSAIRFTLEGRYELAAALIVFAAVIDGLDGLIARRLKATSRFGAELDSLSDFVCFGVAPGILLYRYALLGDPGPGWIFVLVYVICCCLRLARFNVNRDAPPPPGKPRFIGVPAPAGAMLALWPVYLSLGGVLDLRQVGLAVAIYLGLIGLLMVSRVPTLSPKGIRIPRQHVPLVLIGMAFLVGVMLTRFWFLLAVLDALYVVTLVWVAVSSRRAARQSQ